MSWTPSRVALVAITAGVVAAGVGAGVLLQPGRDRPAPADRGPGVNIAVVAPREPVPEPGSVMDVGDLADVYSHGDYLPPPAGNRWTSDLSADLSAEIPPARSKPEPVEGSRLIVSGPTATPRPVVAEQREPPPQRRWPFGFDQPRPDYAAERRDRQARMDAERRFEAAREAERFEDPYAYPEPRRDRGRDALPDRVARERQRQWYSGDGRPVAGPDRFD